MKWFAVSNICEGIKLRKIGIKGEILILGYTPPQEAEKIAEYNIIQACTEYRYAVDLSKYAKGKKVRLHIAVDTGMTRIGLRGNTSEICDEIEKIILTDGISAEGIFTHFSVADSNNSDDVKYTNMQAERITAVDDELKKRGIELNQCHFLNSAGGIYYYKKRSSLARTSVLFFMDLCQIPKNLCRLNLILL